MKTKLTLIFILSFFSIFAQDIKMSKNELTKMLCKEWKIDSIVVNGEKMTLGKSIQDSGIEFKNDNTFVEKPYLEKSEKCSWKYNVEKQCVELFKNDKLIGTIKSVIDGFLVYMPFLDGETKKTVKSSEIYLKPVN
jgi:hypothetical protein